MASQWGRNESIIWPRHSPIYTYGAVFLAFVLTGCFIYLRFNFGQTPLQQFYTPIYARTAAGAVLNKKDKYQLLYVGDGTRAGLLAAEADVQTGTTPAPGGKQIPLALSRAAAGRGLRALYRGPEQTYLDAPLHEYLKSAVFQGDQLRDIYQLPLLFGFLSLLAQLPFSVRKDIARRKQMKYGRLLKGPVMLTPREFNNAVKGDGVGFKTIEAEALMRIPRLAEGQHIEMMGDTGAGKTRLIMQMLMQIKERGHSAIVYDPACEFVQRFYDSKNGDIILNPLDARCPYWGPSEELRRRAEAKAIAASLYQPTTDKKGEFFTETPQKIFAHLLTFGPSPAGACRVDGQPRRDRPPRPEYRDGDDDCQGRAAAAQRRIGLARTDRRQPADAAAQRQNPESLERDRVVREPEGLDISDLETQRARSIAPAAQSVD